MEWQFSKETSWKNLQSWVNYNSTNTDAAYHKKKCVEFNNLLKVA